MPAAIPVFVDWIEHIDERFPEPCRTRDERLDKDSIWKLLNINMIDPAAKNNRHAIDVLFAQFDKPWCPLGVRSEAARALDLIATKGDSDRMVALLDGESWGTRKAVTHYLGRFRTERSHDLLVHVLHSDTDVLEEAIFALGRFKRTEDIALLRPYLDASYGEPFRKAAAQAISKIEKATVT